MLIRAVAFYNIVQSVNDKEIRDPSRLNLMTTLENPRMQSNEGPSILLCTRIMYRLYN